MILTAVYSFNKSSFSKVRVVGNIKEYSTRYFDTMEFSLLLNLLMRHSNVRQLKFCIFRSSHLCRQ